ncbi:hypothetical protein C0J09_10035 [Bordetella avium]|uniref:DMT family transporter n=1 Tax=Bordetella avium TaxID=521 RepID=UPI000FDA6C8A|nr:DMT family transporter [Bordetella avium]AZY49440.1 hypothetical protein C0J09_10035 [Bordetella avium]
MNLPVSLAGLLPMLIALLAGAAVPFQGAGNAALGRALGHPLWATLASLAVSVLVLLPMLFAMRVPMPSLSLALRGPIWLWMGGLVGVAYITAALVLTPKLGAASFIVCVVAGQVMASLLIDHFGLMGLLARPVGLGRVAGVALIVIGMVVVQLNSKTLPRVAAVQSSTVALE